MLEVIETYYSLEVKLRSHPNSSFLNVSGVLVQHYNLYSLTDSWEFY